jgi:hypothetical protein
MVKPNQKPVSEIREEKRRVKMQKIHNDRGKMLKELKEDKFKNVRAAAKIDADSAAAKIRRKKLTAAKKKEAVAERKKIAAAKKEALAEKRKVAAVKKIATAKAAAEKKKAVAERKKIAAAKKVAKQEAAKKRAATAERKKRRKFLKDLLVIYKKRSQKFKDAQLERCKKSIRDELNEPERFIKDYEKDPEGMDEFIDELFDNSPKIMAQPITKRVDSILEAWFFAVYG